MYSEKNLKSQRKALVDVVKKLIFLNQSNPFCTDEVHLTIQRFPNMNEENIKPILELALGYSPKIILYQETIIRDDNKNEIPVVLIVLELK